MDPEDILRSEHGDSRVCSNCIEEPDLSAYIEDAKGEERCTFCGGHDAPTCDFIEFMEHVGASVRAEYDWAANCLSWESAEGGWLWGSTWSTYDLLTNELGIGLPRDKDMSLLKAMVACLGDNQDWCVRNPYGEDPLDVLRAGWNRFCAVIQHHTRFFLDRWPPSYASTYSEVDPYPTPAKLLYAIGDHISRLGLFREVGADITLYRVRPSPRETGPLARAAQRICRAP